MKSTRALNNISDKLRGAASDTAELLRETGNAAARSANETAATASETLRAAAGSSAAVADEAMAAAKGAGRDLYRKAADSTGGVLTQIDRLVTRNPVGALVAALSFGIVLGMLSRR